jgi:hypothetical protein
VERLARRRGPGRIAGQWQGLEQFRYVLHAESLWHAVFTGVTQDPPEPSSVLRQLAQGSVLEFTRPGVAQYSLAHADAQGPLPLAQTQLAMSWKNALLPPMHPV